MLVQMDLRRVGIDSAILTDCLDFAQKTPQDPLID
jgi:hypothetical protein